MAPNIPTHSDPPGKVKIAEALRTLLREKDFNSITTADISRTSGVNEALIYRYYQDKRGLLHAVLAEYLEDYIDENTQSDQESTMEIGRSSFQMDEFQTAYLRLKLQWKKLLPF